MQLLIKHETNGELRLPLNYHHIQQSMIFSKNITEEYQTKGADIFKTAL